MDMNMFLLGVLIGLPIGGTVTLMLYACIIIGKESEENSNNRDKYKEQNYGKESVWNKQE